MTIPNAGLRAAFRSDDETIEPGDPFELFEIWLALAERSEINDASAMAIATVDAEGLPNVRMVLLKSAGPSGFVFYTNTGSQKGRELSANMKCAGVLHWKSLRRQVRFRGPVSPVSSEEADAYFATRSRESRIGAWSSLQSQPLSSRNELEAAVGRQVKRFGTGEIPRPPHWSGYCVMPSHIEFWVDKPFRLHDRLVFRREKPDEPWNISKLYP